MINPLPLSEMLRDRLLRVSVGALALAAIVLFASTVGAVRLDAVPGAAPAPAIADSSLRFASATDAPDVATAVAQDLFTDDRHAPPKRYLMPGETDAERAPAPRPVVLGTALSPGGGDFAVCQVTGGTPRVVRAGEKIGEFTVVAIARGAVTFRGPDGERFTIEASKP
jgi:hypothetical protein